MNLEINSSIDLMMYVIAILYVGFMWQVLNPPHPNEQVEELNTLKIIHHSWFQ